MHRLSLLLVALALAACGDDAAEPALEPPPAPTSPTSSRQTALDVAETSPRLSTFASLVDVAGLRETLADTAQVFTVFAPANAAFADVDLDALRADPEALRARLLAHVLANRTFSGDVFGEITIETVAGSDLTLNATDAGVALRDTRGTAATITEADLDGDNGVVHIIDTLLSGPTGS